MGSPPYGDDPERAATARAIRAKLKVEQLTGDPSRRDITWGGEPQAFFYEPFAEIWVVQFELGVDPLRQPNWEVGATAPRLNATSEKEALPEALERVAWELARWYGPDADEGYVLSWSGPLGVLTYYATRNERPPALLWFWEPVEEPPRGFKDWGRMGPPESGWFWMPLDVVDDDDPWVHGPLQTPDLRPEMTDDEQEEVIETALVAATREILSERKRRGGPD